MAYELVEHIEITSSAASVTISSIPQTGKHLLVKTKIRAGGTLRHEKMYFVPNNATSSDNSKTLKLENTSYASQSWTHIDMPVSAGGATANAFGSAEWFVNDYTASSGNKLVTGNGAASHNNSSQGFLQHTSGYVATGAVTSVTIYIDQSAQSGSLISVYLLS